jgi:hypothetical protein
MAMNSDPSQAGVARSYGPVTAAVGRHPAHGAPRRASDGMVRRYNMSREETPCR